MQPERSDHPEIFGYGDRLEYQPGERVRVHVHSTDGPVELGAVRLRTFDQRVGTTLRREEPVPDLPARLVPAGPQTTWRGSYGICPALRGLCPSDTLTLTCWVWIRAHTANGRQAVLSAVDGNGAAVASVMLVDRDDGADGNRVAATVRTATRSQLLATAETVPARAWVRLELAVHGATGQVELAVSRLGQDRVTRHDWVLDEPPGRLVADIDAVLVAAGSVDRTGNPLGARPTECFTGKVDGIRVTAGDGRGAGKRRGSHTVAEWDGRCDPDSLIVRDVSGNGADLHLVNGPTRAVTGRLFDSTEVDFRRCPEQYSAVHFHADDLDDARWTVTAEVELPGDLPSGVYALTLSSQRAGDHVPFFVVPTTSAHRDNPIAVLMPTWTYLAYANDKVYEEVQHFLELGWTDRECVFCERDRQLEAHAELAGSVYDVLCDGSGQVWSTARRPILNMRPEYDDPIQQGPRHFSADLYLTTWLEQRGHSFDTLTDNVVHRDELSALAGYRVLVTGTHPEYASKQMLDAISAFVEQGGRLMYLGGNFGAWVTTQPAARPDLIQVRRGHAGSRTWSSDAGEVHHDTTGELGGLWRNRGRSPSTLVGLYTSAHGWDRKAPGYRRRPASYDPAHSWIFAGVDGDVFGTEGLAMGGAASDEIDYYDVDEGSPADAAVLATSQRHSKYYKPVLCRIPFIVDGLNGDTNPEVRSDVVYFGRGRGEVFSVGSIGWAGAMAYDNFNNDTARITDNVLDRFLHAPAAVPRQDGAGQS